MIKYIVLLAVGVGAVIIGSVGKKFYYAKGFIGVFLSEKLAPTWLGRSLFLLFGITLVVVSLSHLLLDY